MYIVRRINIHAIYHISVANLREHDEEVAQLLGQKRKKKQKKKNWVRNQICICNVTPDDDYDGNDDEHDDDVAH